MTRHYLIKPYLRWCCLCLAFLSFARVTSAQEILYATARKPNPVSVEQRALRDVLKDIQSHFKISFVYESVLVEGKAISGSVVYKSSVEKTLSAVLTPIGLKYKKINKSTYSILSASQVALTASTVANSTDFDTIALSSSLAGTGDLANDNANAVAEIQVNGRVTDEQSNPIPGANILIKGTTLGTSTDADGRFSISVPDANSVLVISFIGYLSKEIPVGAQTQISV
ncbi:MAG TPA: carboxypeptidase-like regulatory domain-containing protein, partial [Sphingobacteriaceae bacterium]